LKIGNSVDWLGSLRFASLSSGSNRLYYDGAYAPYGENYAETGTQDALETEHEVGERKLRSAESALHWLLKLM
jgi:hypothetical protein